jgi:DNA replication ATP-dependent helicase Dna2
MRKGKRFIFIGDQKQLPPVLLSRSVLDKDTLSIFSRLTSQQADHTVMLNETYRMNRWLTDWPSRTFYSGKLVATGANRERQLTLASYPSCFASVFQADANAVFIPVRDATARNRSQPDAALAAELCQTALAGGLLPTQIGVVTPYRSQGRAIRKELARRLGYEEARQIVADTVERMQGQERELVILSLTSGDKVFLAAVAEFFFQPERLNVSITRAKTKLIVIGPEPENLPPVENEVIRHWMELYKGFICQCVRVEV